MALIPRQIRAGLTADERIELPGFSSEAWAAVLVLRGPEAHNVQLATAGTGHRLQLSAATTAAWAAGTYAYSLRAESFGVVHEVEAGTLEVVADLASVQGVHDARSHAQRTLDAIEAVLEKRASTDQARYTINNRELWRTPVPELLQLRNQYRAEVRREGRKARGHVGLGRTISPLL